MGIYSSAILVWGIPVLAFDDDGEPTKFWDEGAEDWREFEGEIEIYAYGHYEDPDGPRGILTSTRIERYRGDCWEPTKIDPGELAAEFERRKAYSRSNDQAQAAGLDNVDFYVDARWWLVASVG